MTKVIYAVEARYVVTRRDDVTYVQFDGQHADLASAVARAENLSEAERENAGGDIELIGPAVGDPEPVKNGPANDGVTYDEEQAKAHSNDGIEIPVVDTDVQMPGPQVGQGPEPEIERGVNLGGEPQDFTIKNDAPQGDAQ